MALVGASTYLPERGGAAPKIYDGTATHTHTHHTHRHPADPDIEAVYQSVQPHTRGVRCATTWLGGCNHHQQVVLGVVLKILRARKQSRPRSLPPTFPSAFWCALCVVCALCVLILFALNFTSCVMEQKGTKCRQRGGILTRKCCCLGHNHKSLERVAWAVGGG